MILEEKRGSQAGVGGQIEVLGERGEERVHASIVAERRAMLPEKWGKMREKCRKNGINHTYCA
jgi:hypothetical protein